MAILRFTMSAVILTTAWTLSSASPLESNSQSSALQVATVRISEIVVPKTQQPTVKKTNIIKKRHLVEGYRNSKYLHGSIRLEKKNHFTGYLYPARNQGNKIYVYGEVYQKQFIAYDSAGNLYQLQFLD